jgi:autonomous glycyl radical cofactor GrcA
MLPWRPTLSKTLTKYVVKFEFLNDVIKKPKIYYQLIFLLLKYAVKLIVTQDSCQINVFVMCAVYSYLL